MGDDAAAIRRIQIARRKREAIFPGGLFHDPAWDILLDLYAARIEGRLVSVSSACIAGAVPGTTGLRWVNALEQHGLLIRGPDAVDKRRSHLTISDTGFQLMEELFEWSAGRGTSVDVQAVGHAYLPATPAKLANYRDESLVAEMGRRLNAMRQMLARSE